MNSYKITFKLNTPVSFIDIPTFDGILAYAFVRESFEKKKIPFVRLPDTDIIDFSEMPVNMHPDGYFIASSMSFEKNTLEDMQHWRKRWDQKNQHIADCGGKARQYEQVRGQFKSYDVRIATKIIPECCFFFQSDNIESVEKLVAKWIHFIGKKRAQGYGEIDHFTIEDTDFDFNTIYRPIPKKFVSDQLLFNELTVNKRTIKFMYCAWKPPYWLPENFEECIICTK
jgi:CRISPR type IV-associated protein Csf3